jgi:KipI family sensor histidine kinase inhibitor
MRLTYPRIDPLGEGAFTLALGDAVDPDTHSRTLALAARLRRQLGSLATEIVPGFASVTVFFDPTLRDGSELRHLLDSELAAAVVGDAPPRPPAGRLHKIAVRYNGPDLRHVARETGLSIDDVVQRHSAVTYTVFLLGFAPGFAYLGPVDPTLRLPRRPQPRLRVEPGSVAMAGAQTAIYPLPTPGGWHLLGYTDATVFDPHRAAPALFAPGDRVRFVRA